MMRKTLTQLEQATLEWVAQDYENVETICDNISEDIGQEITQADIYLSLVKLHKKKLIEAYLYDLEAQRYVVTTSPEKHEMKAVWWLESKMAQKQQEVGACTCPCHTNPHAVLHPVPCCETCSKCKRGIARGSMEEHLEICSGLRRK